MSEFSFTDFILAILVLIGACVGGYWSYLGSQNAIKTQLKNETKNVAKAFKLDIKTIQNSPYFFTAYKLYTEEKSTTFCKENIGNTPTPHYPPYPFYNIKTGLYFIYQHDLPKLDYNLSIKICNFYNDLIVAEDFRYFISQNPNFMEELDGEIVQKYGEMTKFSSSLKSFLHFSFSSTYLKHLTIVLTLNFCLSHSSIRSINTSNLNLSSSITCGPLLTIVKCFF